MHKELTKNIISELKEVYSKYNFLFDKKNYIFSNGPCSVYWNVIRKTSDSVYFKPRLAVNLTEISNILSTVFPKETLLTSLQLQSDVMIFIFKEEIDDVKMDKFKTYAYETNYKISNEEDILKVVDHHFFFMENIGFKYFENFTSLDKMNSFLNTSLLRIATSDIENINFYQNFFDRREVLSAIIASYFIDNKKHEETISLYKDFFIDNNYMLNSIETLNNYLLNEISPNGINFI